MRSLIVRDNGTQIEEDLSKFQSQIRTNSISMNDGIYIFLNTGLYIVMWNYMSINIYMSNYTS